LAEAIAQQALLLFQLVATAAAELAEGGMLVEHR
jgi:hypothetical protein